MKKMIRTLMVVGGLLSMAGAAQAYCGVGGGGGYYDYGRPTARISFYGSGGGYYNSPRAGFYSNYRPQARVVVTTRRPDFVRHGHFYDAGPRRSVHFHSVPARRHYRGW